MFFIDLLGDLRHWSGREVNESRGYSTHNYTTVTRVPEHIPGTNTPQCMYSVPPKHLIFNSRIFQDCIVDEHVLQMRSLWPKGNFSSPDTLSTEFYASTS